MYKQTIFKSITWWAATIIIVIVAIAAIGCTSNPTPNIVIGGSEWCPPGTVNLTIVTDNDKALIGDDTTLNDEDSGLTNPTLGITP